jgi:outer membrane receptor protein involved in Fe transport
MEQVEVLKGASSALFGSSALNGVINMRTKMPGEKPVTQITTFAGMYDTPKNEYMRWWGEERFTSGVNFSHRRKIKSLIGSWRTLLQ